MSEKINYFPDLPPYRLPTAFPLSYLHPNVHPYIQLMRLDRPKGFIYFLLPHLFGAIHASILLSNPVSLLVRRSLILLIGTFFLRGATCTWNDTVDAPFDRQVARTRHRPLARGAVSTTTANIFTTVQTMAAIAVLAILPPACTLYAVPAVIGWILYPLSKRVTYYPQVVLGLPMAWGVLMGAAAVGADPLQIYTTEWPLIGAFTHVRTTSTFTSPDAAAAIRCLYLANVAWTLSYETVYSYQDVRDDIKVGVKNIAILLDSRAKPVLSVLALVQVSLLAAVGHLTKSDLLFYEISVAGTAVALVCKIWNVNLQDSSSCLWWFSNGSMITGSMMMAGFIVEYIGIGRW